MARHTVTRAEVQAQKIEHKIAFSHIPGQTKWLHLMYDIGRARMEYRLRILSASDERTFFFDALDEAIAAYNEI